MGPAPSRSYVADAGYRAPSPGEDPAVVAQRIAIANALNQQAAVANTIVADANARADDNPFNAINNAINNIGDGAKKGAEDATTLLIVGGVVVVAILLLK